MRLAIRTRAGELTCVLLEGLGDTEIASVMFIPISIFIDLLGRCRS
jgi:hypothetical protein